MSKHQTLPFNPIIWPAVPHDFTGDLNLGYYTEETTQRYISGTRGITWDGKVFKYGRLKGTSIPGQAVFNGASSDVSDLIDANSTVKIVAGDRSTLITVDNAEGYDDGPVAEDELCGAQFVVGHGSGIAETRTVIGNTAVPTGGGTSTIYVDAPWAVDHDAGFMELPLNAYHYLKPNIGSYAGAMGIPNVAADTGYFIWIQSWGPCWCTPGGGDPTPGDSANDRTVFFVGDGSVNGGTALTTETGYQLAGFIMDTNENAVGCMPMVMLQISI